MQQIGMESPEEKEKEINGELKQSQCNKDR
jgi:hypothetical protein